MVGDEFEDGECKLPSLVLQTHFSARHRVAMFQAPKPKNSLRTLRKYTDEIVRYEVAPIIIVRMASTFPFSQGTII